MQRYVDQLIEDIEEIIKWQTAQKQPSKQSDDDDMDMEAEFEEIERYVSGEGEVHFGEHCGLSKIQFPPPERLSFEQMNQISNAMDRLMFSFHLRAALPDVIPVVMAYQTFVNVLEKEVMMMDFGMITIEFCDYEWKQCPWGVAYCTCIDFLEEAEKEEFKQTIKPPIVPQNELFVRQLSEMEYLQKRMEYDSPSNWTEEDGNMDDDIPF